MVQQLSSYLHGEWIQGTGKSASLVNPATEEVLAETSSEGFDFVRALNWTRDVGGPALRAMTFAERGAMLKKLAQVIYDHRDELLNTGIANGGTTRSDAKFDVDGASAVLQYYGELPDHMEFGDGPWIKDGTQISLGASSRLAGQHVWVPLEGAAVLINAYNFPAWGMIEKAACAWLAGVPVLSKPATATALLAHHMVEILLKADVLPQGALSLLAGPAGDLLTHVDERDMVAFTGSADTGAWIRSLENVRARSVRLNVEADSLNAAVLAVDVESGSDTFHQFIGDVARDMTQKTGQKCTAIRRIFVPESRLDAVREALISRLADVKVGDPAVDSVRMGPLSSKSALKAVTDGLEKLKGVAKVAWSGEPKYLTRDEFSGKGFYHPATLLEIEAGAAADVVHEVEVFGPVSTLVPYRDEAEAIALVRRGGGGLVASIYTDDRKSLKNLVGGLAVAHGRLYLGSKKVAGSAGPGTALAPLKHGGPGRAGGGEELAGERGMFHFMQRVALQGYGPLVEWLLK